MSYYTYSTSRRRHRHCHSELLSCLIRFVIRVTMDQTSPVMFSFSPPLPSSLFPPFYHPSFSKSSSLLSLSSFVSLFFYILLIYLPIYCRHFLIHPTPPPNAPVQLSTPPPKSYPHTTIIFHSCSCFLFHLLSDTYRHCLRYISHISNS